MKKAILLLISATLLFSCRQSLKDPEDPNDQSDDLIYIGKKETLHSGILGEDRPYWVYVPPYTVNSGKKFPVLYLLDGDAHFHSVSGMIHSLGTNNNVVPEMIVVGIPNTNRTRDLTPSHSTTMEGKTHDFLEPSGGGTKFLSFIKDELIPRIDSLYPTHPYRVLVGHSFGGITALNALYTMPEAFDAYIAIDPSLWWDQQSLLKKADTVFSTNKLNNKYLFLGQANTLDPGQSTNEHFGSIKQYVDVLKSPLNTSGIRWSYEYYPEDSHGSVPLITEYDGLRFIFHDFNSYEKFGTDLDLLISNFAQYKLPPPEGAINQFGYAALAKKDLDLAQRYFQMNIDAYPKSSNAHDSMGELLLNKGDTTKAVEMYKKALDLDPKNESAKKQLKDLMKD